MYSYLGHKTEFFFCFLIENWDEWQGDLDGEGECCVRNVCIKHSTPATIVFSYDDGLPVMSNDDITFHSP